MLAESALNVPPLSQYALASCGGELVCTTVTSLWQPSISAGVLMTSELRATIIGSPIVKVFSRKAGAKVSSVAPMSVGHGGVVLG